MIVILRVKEGYYFLVADVIVVVCKIIDGAEVELYIPENGHRYVISERVPVEMKEVEEVWFESRWLAQAAIAEVVVHAPKEFPVTPGGGYWRHLEAHLPPAA